MRLLLESSSAVLSLLVEEEAADFLCPLVDCFADFCFTFPRPPPVAVVDSFSLAPNVSTYKRPRSDFPPFVKYYQCQ
jgi:hypothetical protein